VIPSGTYLLYDGAMGTGGMLTVAEETLKTMGAERGKQIVTHLYGQEINAETYAIAKADLILKGEGEAADNLLQLSKLELGSSARLNFCGSSELASPPMS
jgi:type I restriction enzyme M protein